MIAFPEDFRARELRLLVLRAQYERYVEAQTAALVERTLHDVLDVLTSRTYRDLTIAQRARAEAMYRELTRIIREGYTTITDDLAARMQGYAQLESDVSRATVNAVLNAGGGDITVSFYRLPRNYLESIATLPVDGVKAGDWYAGQANGMSLRTKQTIQKGMIEGKNPAEIARQILAPERAAVKAGEAPPLSTRAKAEAKTIARTTVNAVQNDATKKSNAALPRSVSDSYMWVSVRDRRTSAICRGLDGRVWTYDDPGALRPPAHPNCRSTTRALIRGAVLPIDDQRVPPTMRSYEGWLEGQPTSVQNGILGPTRAQWWRDKRMSLADAIDSDNRVLTLPQLRTKLGLDGVLTH